MDMNKTKFVSTTVTASDNQSPEGGRRTNWNVMNVRRTSVSNTCLWSDMMNVTVKFIKLS